MIESISKNDKPLKAPFPWFGGKSKVAPIVWEMFGDVERYREPFFGSGAVLLGRPRHHKNSNEIINDIDGYVCNFWRSVKCNPGDVERWSDAQLNENEYHARRSYLKQFEHKLPSLLEGDVDFYDSRIAGYWLYSVRLNIGKPVNWPGPWVSENGMFLKRDGRNGIERPIPSISRYTGRGFDLDLFSLKRRLDNVAVCCGDWKRICKTKSTILGVGATGIFLDPPYGPVADRDGRIYSNDSFLISESVYKWCIEWGKVDNVRIALCGYEGEYDLPGWDKYSWKATGGYGNQAHGRGRENAHRERIWFSPACLKKAEANDIFEMAAGQ